MGLLDFFSKKKLNTGDYSIEGMESIFTIERKMSVSEIANNITENRFKDVLDRLDKVRDDMDKLKRDSEAKIEKLNRDVDNKIQKAIDNPLAGK